MNKSQIALGPACMNPCMKLNDLWGTRMYRMPLSLGTLEEVGSQGSGVSRWRSLSHYN